MGWDGMGLGWNMIKIGLVLTIKLSFHEKKYESLFLQVLKRHATVRFMFFNREDIEWFKPIELRTKMGRRGHIKVFKEKIKKISINIESRRTPKHI